MLLTGVPLQKLVLPLHQKLNAAAQRLTHATEQALLRLGPFLWPCWATGSTVRGLAQSWFSLDAHLKRVNNSATYCAVLLHGHGQESPKL